VQDVCVGIIVYTHKKVRIEVLRINVCMEVLRVEGYTHAGKCGY